MPLEFDAIRFWCHPGPEAIPLRMSSTSSSLNYHRTDSVKERPIHQVRRRPAGFHNLVHLRSRISICLRSNFLSLSSSLIFTLDVAHSISSHAYPHLIAMNMSLVRCILLVIHRRLRLKLCNLVLSCHTLSYCYHLN